VARRRRRVLLLTHKELYARPSLEGLTERETLPWRTAYQVFHGLRAMGHDVRQLGLDDSLGPLHRELDRSRPDIVFNLLLELRDSGGYEPHVVAALEARGVSYTGCNSEGLVLARDKALSKTLLRAYGVPVPDFAAIALGSRARRVAIDFPVIVKPNDGSGSVAISEDAIVQDAEALAQRVALLHDRYGLSVIVERFIAGRELTVGLLGNSRPTALPVMETEFGKLPDTAPRILTRRLKWDLPHRRELGVECIPARGLAAADRARVSDVARRAFRALRLSGFARVDVRLAADGAAYVVDVNPNADLDTADELALAAAAAGLSHHDLLQRVLDLGLGFRPRWDA